MTDEWGRDGPETEDDSPLPIVKLMRTLIVQAVAADADGLIVRPTDRSVMVEFGVGGERREYTRVPLFLHEDLIKAFKEMAAPTEMSSDAGKGFAIEGRPYVLFFTFASTPHGESVTIRLLPDSSADTTQDVPPPGNGV